jgi:hypothetical protein
LPEFAPFTRFSSRPAATRAPLQLRDVQEAPHFCPGRQAGVPAGRGERPRAAGQVAALKAELQQLKAELQRDRAARPSSLNVEWDVRGISAKLAALTSPGQQIDMGGTFTVGGRELFLPLHAASGQLFVRLVWEATSTLPSNEPIDVGGTTLRLLTAYSVSDPLGGGDYAASSPITLTDNLQQTGRADWLRKGYFLDIWLLPLAYLSSYATEGDTLRLRATIRVKELGAAPFRKVTV